LWFRSESVTKLTLLSWPFFGGWVYLFSGLLGIYSGLIDSAEYPTYVEAMLVFS
jgi:hypothetical protein